MEYGETRMISNFSPLFASELIISQRTSSIKVYHIRETPALRQEPEIYQEHYDVTLTAEDMLVQSHFLNEGSVINVTLRYLSQCHIEQIRVYRNDIEVYRSFTRTHAHFSSCSATNEVNAYLFGGTTDYRSWVDDVDPDTWLVNLLCHRFYPQK